MASKRIEEQDLLYKRTPPSLPLRAGGVPDGFRWKGNRRLSKDDDAMTSANALGRSAYLRAETEKFTARYASGLSRLCLEGKERFVHRHRRPL